MVEEVVEVGADCGLCFLALKFFLFGLGCFLLEKLKSVAGRYKI